MIKGNVKHNGHQFEVYNDGTRAQVFIWQGRQAYHLVNRSSGVLVGCLELTLDEIDVYMIALDLAKLVYEEMIG